MRYWERIDGNGKVIDRIVISQETVFEDFRWIQKNLGGTWRLAQTNNSDDEK